MKSGKPGKSSAQKGQKGYLKAERKRLTLRTVLLFALPLAIFLLGYFSTHSRNNLLTIVAVLGCLPACRCLVNLIMVMRYHGISDELYAKIKPYEGSCTCFTDLVFTGYEKTFEIMHMAMKGDQLIGYATDPKCDPKACEKHLNGLFAQNALREVDIKIFKDLSAYTRRLSQIDSLENQEKEEQDSRALLNDLVGSLLKAISL